MILKKRKGQGALEYLLLIGGAVLIAVIVIALLVGMGGQSRDTAQNQATQAQQALDKPQAATIVNIEPDDCTDNSDGNLTIQWQKIGEGGIYDLHIYDYQDDEVVVDVNNTADNKLTDPRMDVDVTAIGECEDSYWAEIITTKNSQTAKSTRMKFNW